MKKGTIFLLLFASIFACSSPDSEKDNGVTSQRNTKIDTTGMVDFLKVDEYQKFLAKLDSTDVNSSLKAVVKYSELLKGADPEICDLAVVSFHDFYEKIERNLIEQVIGNTTIQDAHCAEYDENGKQRPMSKVLADLDLKLKKNGFRLECWEGMPGVGTYRSFIAKNFYKSISPTMRKFLNKLQENDDKVLSVDAGIVLTEKEFVDRTVWWETFVKENPNFILIDRAKSMKKEYFTYLIYGMNNTAAVDFMTETNGTETMSELNDYFVKAYNYLNKKYPDSETNKRIKPYFKATVAGDKTKVLSMRKEYAKKGYIIDFERDSE